MWYKWISLCGISTDLQKKLYICNRHFELCDMTRNLKKTCLSKNKST